MREEVKKWVRVVLAGLGFSTERWKKERGTERLFDSIFLMIYDFKGE